MRRDRLCLHPLAAAGYHTTCQTINWSLASLRQYEIGRLCRFRLGIMLLRADAAMRWLFSQVSELRAGEMLRLAGCSSGTGVCARGGTAGRERFCRSVSRSAHACCLPHSAKQDGLRCLSFLFRRVEIAFVRSRGAFRLSALAGSLRACAFICGDLDGLPGRRGTGYGRTGLAARPFCAFAQPHRLCESFRGEYAGAARPRLRQRVFDSLDSPHAAAGLCWYKYPSLQKAQAPQSAHPCSAAPGYTERPARL